MYCIIVWIYVVRQNNSWYSSKSNEYQSFIKIFHNPYNYAIIQICIEEKIYIKNRLSEDIKNSEQVLTTTLKLVFSSMHNDLVSS